MRYLIVTRGDEIYKLPFYREDEDLILNLNLRNLGNMGIFYPLQGYIASRVLNWLDDRSFEYYWEDEHD